MSLLRSLTVAAVSLLSIAGASELSQSTPSKVPAVFDRVYAPHGFDSNDHVQITGEGLFRNTCYRHAQTTVRIDNDAHQIFLGPVAYEYSGLCLQIILPFERTIDLGLLKPGSWEVRQETSGALLGSLSIREASSANADDFLYAPISQAFFRQSGADGEILLTGEFSNSCLSLDRVETQVSADSIVLQPIARFDAGPSCSTGKFPFSHVVTVLLIPPGRYLLHVRSMNGHAVNSLVEVR